MKKHLGLLLCSLFLIQSCSDGENPYTNFNPTFPRLMGINFGGSYSDPSYQKAVSKYDVVVTSFYPEWDYKKDRLKDTLAAIKKYNPNILILNYSIFNDVSKGGDIQMNEDIRKKVDQEDWWLRTAGGALTQIEANAYNYYSINVTEWASRDSEGLNFPQWRAKRDHEKFFSKQPDLDGWYVDITDFKPPVPLADFKRSGGNIPNTNPEVMSSYRKTQVEGWQQFRKYQSDKLIIGNIDHVINETSPEFVDKLNGAFLESLTGRSWSLMNAGWDKAMDRYHETMDHVLAPKLVGFGFRGSPTDYQNMRYGLTSCLMNDGYYSYSNIDTGYTEALWFDEYDARLGYPIDQPQTKAWSKGVFRRDFDKGIALVNPTDAAVTVTIENGFKRIKGTQDPAINSGAEVSSITIASKDGIILLKK